MKPDDPRMASVECPLAQHDYANGMNGLEIAESWITACLHAVFTVRETRAKNPRTFPDYGDASPEESSRRIMARLLDAGWRPPDTESLDLPGLPDLIKDAE